MEASKRMKKEANKLAAKSAAGLSGLHAALNGSEEKVSHCHWKKTSQAGLLILDLIRIVTVILTAVPHWAWLILGQIEAGLCDWHQTIEGKDSDQRRHWGENMKCKKCKMWEIDHFLVSIMETESDHNHNQISFIITTTTLIDTQRSHSGKRKEFFKKIKWILTEQLFWKLLYDSLVATYKHNVVTLYLSSGQWTVDSVHHILWKICR